MSVFVDTSALLARLDDDDRWHGPAVPVWSHLADASEVLVCTSYVVSEASALVQNRLGMQAVRALHEEIRPLLGVVWVTEDVHDAGVAALLALGRRQVSLVDCVSFEVMRRVGLSRVFAFDPHFEEQGFEVLPAQP